MLSCSAAPVLFLDHPMMPLILFVGDDDDAGVCYSEPCASAGNYYLVNNGLHDGLVLLDKLDFEIFG